MEGIQNKYSVKLKVGGKIFAMFWRPESNFFFFIPDVIILSKKKSMGTPKSQRIRMDGPVTPSGPLISEICPAQANDLKPRSRVPKYKIRGEPAKGKLLKMIAELTLPDVVKVS